jgi:flagellar basal body-associated protein FliL
MQYHFQATLGVANTTVVYWKKTAEKGKDDILTLTVNIPTYCASELMIMESEKLSGFSVQAATDNIYSSLQNFIDELNDATRVFGVDGFKPQTPVQLSTSVYNPTCAPNDFSIGSTYDCKSANGVSPFPQDVTKVSNGDKSNKTALIAIIIALSVVIAVMVGVGIALYFIMFKRSESPPKQPKQKKTEAKKATTDQPTHPSEADDVESQIEIKVLDHETDDVETDSMDTNKTDSKVSNDKGEAEGERSTTTTVDEVNEVEQTAPVEEDDSPVEIDVVGSTLEVDVEPPVENNVVESMVKGEDDKSTVQSKDVEPIVEGINGEQTGTVIVSTEANTTVETNDAVEPPVVEPNVVVEPTLASTPDQVVDTQTIPNSDKIESTSTTPIEVDSIESSS